MLGIFPGFVDRCGFVFLLVSKANPADCVDMDCDAKKKSLLKDLDGSFLGAVGSVVPQSEFEWGGDPRRGLGDYRIPKVMLTFLNGSRIPVEQVAPRKGKQSVGETRPAEPSSHGCSRCIQGSSGKTAPT